MSQDLRRVGHKGADAVVPGNTVASFEAAANIGVEMIEFDVLWTPAGNPEFAPGERAPLTVAHDWDAAGKAEAAGQSLSLDSALEAFNQERLRGIQLDCDLKLPGREHELVDALQNHGLIERAMISTMELDSLRRIGELEPGLRRGWTYPRVTRDWTARRWALPGIYAALIAMRRRLPTIAARELPRLGVEAMWVYHPIITPRLAEVTAAAGVELIAWTVDELPAMQRLVDHGATGLCSNDPRLFADLDPEPSPAAIRSRISPMPASPERASAPSRTSFKALMDPAPSSMPQHALEDAIFTPCARPNRQP